MPSETAPPRRSERLRVVHVPMMDWSPTEGVARACTALARELHDVESHLVTASDPGAGEHPFAAWHANPGWIPRALFRPAFSKLVDAIDPDIVHLHGGSIAPALAYAPAFKGRTVVATSLSGVALPDRAQLRVARLVEHVRSNVTLTRSAAAAAGGVEIARRALRSGRVAVLCTPDAEVEESFSGSGPVVRVTGAATVAPTGARWSDEPVVVFAGRAERARGVDDLVAAFPRLRREIPGARLRLILLPGPEAARWATALAGVPWAEVGVGAVDDLQAELARCQVAAFPFRWSATLTPALAAAEAMAAGLPLVATSVSCLAPLVEPGRNGYLVEPSDPAALGNALADTLRDRLRWGELAQGARKTIEERWSWAGAADATRRAYDLALERRRAR